MEIIMGKKMSGHTKAMKPISRPKYYDKYTLGKSPAELYMVHVLNTTQNNKDHNVLRSINNFRDLMSKLIAASGESVLIDEKVIDQFCNLKRIELDILTEQHLESGMSPLVVDLYRNIIIGDLKRCQRKTSMARRVVKAGIALIRVECENRGIDKVDFAAELIINDKEVYIGYDSNGNTYHSLDWFDLNDDITPEILQERSRKKLERQGKINTLY